MPERLLECVPNISEGADPALIRQLQTTLYRVEGVQLLHVDRNEAAHRTVFTFIGEPEAVIEGAFQLIKRTSELLDMSQHTGEHPRMGATDVCPLIPYRDLTMDEAVSYAQKLGSRVGGELAIPVYLYEYAATKPERQSLAQVRKGKYEGMADKLKTPGWEPDYGPAELHRQAGVTAIGARDFLIAYNINLNTMIADKAHAVACDVRESGRPLRDEQGTVVKDEQGCTKRIPGALPKVRGLGWYIADFGQAQISLNIRDIEAAPIHQVFDTVVSKAHERGLRVTGSEVVGMVPRSVLLKAGRHYLIRQDEDPQAYTERETVDMAVLSLELSDVVPFDPAEKVIEYQLQRVENPDP